MLAVAALLLVQQAAPVPEPAADDQEIVVTATLGHTTMLFDKGADGKLRNCRVMKSSGSQRRDTSACQATPVCYAKTAEVVTDCVDLVVVEPKPEVAYGKDAKTNVFDIPKLAQPKPLPIDAFGPSEPGAESRETERQRVKLPPLPKPPTSGPVITINGGKTE
jgi:hypothetical protein